MIKKKVLIIGSIPPPYHGVTFYNLELLKSKISNYFKIYHFDISDKRGLDNIGNLDLINITLSFKNIFKLTKVIVKVKPDLVYIPISQNIAYLRDGLFIIIAKLFCKSKIVVHLHGSYFGKYYNKSNLIIKKFIDCTLKKVDLAIVLGNSLKSVLKKWINKIEVIPNGINFFPNLVERSTRGKEELILSYLGNLTKEKGIIELVKGIKIVLEKYENIKIKIAGPWRYKEKDTKKTVLEYINKNFIGDKIEFIGFLPSDQKEKFLLETDIFIFPSSNEGQPFVILEAMAAGNPVISIKNIGAINDTVINGKTGILINKQDPIRIAEAIIYLIKNPKKRLQMGKLGYERFKRKYTLDENINNIINVFNKIILPKTKSQ